MNLFENQVSVLGTPDDNIVVHVKRYDRGEHISISPHTIVVSHLNGIVRTMDVYKKNSEELRIVNMLKYGEETGPGTEEYTVSEVRNFLSSEEPRVKMTVGGYR